MSRLKPVIAGFRYDLLAGDGRRRGTINLERIVNDNIALCEALSNPETEVGGPSGSDALN